ncbi:protein S40-1-like [Phragmites australis]|uniref:protein S40-1-like n=1 Tax=Phragmites australis TaxID=29695 RepID=UPI002D782A3A|nr:protein S40-1-like [Phragmites australis]
MSQNAVLSARCAAWAQERERRPFTEPIEIPAVSGARADEQEASQEAEDQAGDDGEVVPPHVLLARRRAAFSVCSGQGRTLKGRDLRRVRDSVLRMTGFIES